MPQRSHFQMRGAGSIEVLLFLLELYLPVLFECGASFTREGSDAAQTDRRGMALCLKIKRMQLIWVDSYTTIGNTERER